MTESIPVISVRCDQIDPSPANKRKGRLLRIGELAESIRQHGLMQEPLVRPLGDRFEMVAGERRWRACCLIGETISVKVRELSDEEAHELTFAENHDREDLEPIEEAEFIQVMLNDGKSVEEIASRFGRSVQWVAKRSKLINLTPQIKELLQSDVKSGVASWSAAHLELLARFEHHIQNAFLSQYDCYGNNREPHIAALTLSDLKDSLDSYLMKLSSVPWKLDDDQLLNTAGSCANCQKRTSLQTSLFDQLEEKGKVIDQCIDKECWSEKYKRYVAQKKEILVEKNPDLILLDQSNYNDAALEDDDPLKETALRTHQVVNCKKGDEGAKQALVIDGYGAGTTRWVRPLNETPSSGRSAAPKTLEERYDGLYRKQLFKVINQIIVKLREEIDSPSLLTRLEDNSAIAIAIIWGSRRFESLEISANSDFDLFDSWKQFDTYLKQHKDGDYCPDLARCVLPGWIEIFVAFADNKSYSGIHRDAANRRKDDAEKFAKRVCKLLKIDFEELTRQAELEIKPPKSWERLNRDGTPKTAAKEESEEQQEEFLAGKKKSKKKKLIKETANDDDDSEDPDEL
jgi:ParB/RepB/Spo0J family partition protein